MKKRILLSLAVLVCCLLKGLAQPNCQAIIMALPVQGTTTVNFYDSSYAATGSITSWTWAFGDGGSSTQMNPSHTYNGAGAYTVCLTIVTSTGCTDSSCISITIGSGCSIGGVSMAYDSTTHILTTAPFGGTAPYTYLWSTGSNQSVISATTPGVYCCTVTDANGCTGYSCYTVQGTGSCQANFIAQQIQANSWQFTDNSTVNSGSVTYLWNFGDGNTSTQQNPIHTFVTGGVYTVCLYINTSTGCSDQTCQVITINGCNMYVYPYLDSSLTYIQAYVSGGTAPYSYQWSNGATTPTITPTVAGSYCVTVTDANSCSASNCYTYVGAPTDTLCGVIFNDLNGNGILDGSEQGLSNAYVYIYGNGVQTTAFTNSSGNYSVAVPPGSYTILYCPNGISMTFTVPTTDTAGCAVYNNVVVSGSGTFCGYNFGYELNSVTITGTIFIDANSNGLQDVGEAGIPNQYVIIGSYYAYTNSNGEYTIIVGSGNHTITYTPNGYYTGATLTTAGTITLTGTTSGNTYANNNFGVFVVPGATNLMVTLVPHTTVTPGFGAWYDIQVCNLGSNPSGGTLTMIHDPSLSFDYSSPAQTSYNSGTQTLTWNVPTLAPGQCTYYWVDFTASTSLQVGDNTFEFVNLNATSGIDVDLSNNSDSLHQIVTASWDPNNKLAVNTNYIDPNFQVISSVNPNQTIDYTINFQNTGTSPAVNISVVDVLSSDLDANSFMLLGTSHTANVIRNGSNVTFQFPNIMLPDVISNPNASHGFVNFRVNAINGLAVGHVITDDAAIFFDFNNAVITNPANVQLINPLGIENVPSVNGLSIFPNPVKENATLQFNLNNASPVSISLFDLQGKQVAVFADKNMEKGAHSLNIDASHLSSGVYMLTLKANDFTSSIKVNVLK